jgi:hypothetical protein
MRLWGSQPEGGACGAWKDPPEPPPHGRATPPLRRYFSPLDPSDAQSVDACSSLGIPKVSHKTKVSCFHADSSAYPADS